MVAHYHRSGNLQQLAEENRRLYFRLAEMARFGAKHAASTLTGKVGVRFMGNRQNLSPKNHSYA